MPDDRITSTSNGRRTAEQRRERIITAARLLFARHGFHGTGVAQIARQSDVLVGQIYRDFASKEDLIAAIVERDLAELLDNAAVAGAIADADAARLRDWVAAFIAHRPDPESQRVFADIVAEANRNERVATIMREAHMRLRARLAAAAEVWAPGPRAGAARIALADLILTAAGATLHRHLCHLAEGHETATGRLIDLVDQEIARLAQR